MVLVERLVLQAQSRQLKGKKVKRLLRLGLIPAVVFGKDVGSRPIQLAERDALKAVHQAGMSRLINLQVDSETIPVLIRGAYFEPTTHRLHHIDLWAVPLREEVTVSVPVVLTGESPAVRAGGVLIQQLEAIEIRSLPEQIPDAIHVDISRLERFYDAVRVEDIEPPPGVRFVTEPDTVIAVVEPPQAAEEAEAEEQAEAGSAE